MSFGYSIGDVVAVGTLAWNIYVSCKDAPVSFGRISTEVLSLHAVLKEVKGAIKIQPLPLERQQNLAIIIDGCNGVLKDLQILVVKYERMNTQSQRTWDRMRYGFEDITELRARVTSNVTMLTAFMSMSQLYVERKLNKLREEFQNGHRQGSAVSEATVDSLTMEDREAWRAIRKELEDIGISIAAFEANRPFIVKWLQNAIDTNALEEVSGPEDNDPGVPATSSELEPLDERRSSANRVGGHSIKISNTSTLDSSHVVAADETDSLRDFSGDSSLLRLTAPICNESPNQTNAKIALKMPKPRVEEIQDHLLRLSLEEVATASPFNTVSKSITRSRKQPSKINSIISRMLRYDQELVKAYESGKKLDAEKLLNKGADIDSLFRRGSLTKAIMENNLRDASWLLENGLKINRDHLAAATETGQVDMMQLLIRHGASLTSFDEGNRTLLILAASNGQLQAIEMLLESGIAIDQTNSLDQTALHRAAAGGKHEVVKFLTSKGASISSTDLSGDTPLHKAASCGSVDTASHLMEKGADIHVLNRLSETPVHAAARYGNADTVELLFSKGADINVSNWEGTRPLHFAASLGYTGLATALSLLRLGADINPVDVSRNAPLHYAAKANFVPMVELLVDSGADLNLENLAGETALLIALMLKNDRTARKLVDLGTQLDRIVLTSVYQGSGDNLHNPGPQRLDQIRNETYLHVAASHQCYDTVRAMLERGMDPSRLNGRGETPQDPSRFRGDSKMNMIFRKARIDKEEEMRKNISKEETQDID